MLDAEGLQIYAFSLWQLGKQDLALSLVRNLAVSVSTMEQKSVAAPVSFICRMLYCISGLDSAISSILKMPKKLFQNSRVSFIVSAIHALDQSNRLESFISSSRSFVQSPAEVAGMHFLIALSKLVSFLFQLLELEPLKQTWAFYLFIFFGKSWGTIVNKIGYCYDFGLCRSNMEQNSALEFRVELLILEKLFTCSLTAV
jgi:hypothetical protein